MSDVEAEAKRGSSKLAESFVDAQPAAARSTSVRIQLTGMLTVMGCLLYLDRYAVGIASERIREDLQMTQTQMSWFLSLFFWSYALSQVPAGWLSDRFGPRKMLTAYILGWSLFTGMIGAATQVWQILQLRFLCGAAQAGAFPVSSGLVRAWFPVARRGAASSMVALGGRTGACLAPILTAALMTAYAGEWRPVLIAYGTAGIVIAIAFAIICRDTPRQHPWCNEAECELIEGSDKNHSRSAPADQPPFPWRAVLTTASLWGNSLTQLFTNIGWLFVVTWLPRYLERVHTVPLNEQALMTAVPTLAGILGMFCGGWWTDRMARQFGLKWGRRLPVMITRFMAACGYLMCLFVGLASTPDPHSRWLPWVIIVGLSMATFCCDLGVPALWAYAQDVGGKFTASIMGWTNMFGNLGAAIAPLIYNAVLGETPALQDWNNLFAVCAGMFVLSGCAALVLDSTKPIMAEASA
ncbi:MFS transporter [Schlesneria paludicola]|uniref:MFS transporter n=1 Tax=Schlesneria paludicola TaxID=360056 RepID=UPI00029AC7A1|nr:MFS transporter [Schlesneria paludicola]